MSNNPDELESVRPTMCPRGFECKWVKPYNTRGIDYYVKWRTREALDGCINRSVYEDYIEFCEKNNIDNPCGYITLMKALTNRFGFKIHSVRKGDKVYRVLMLM